MRPLNEAPQLSTWTAEEWVRRMYLFEAWRRELDLTEAARAGIITVNDADKYRTEWADWAAVDWGG